MERQAGKPATVEKGSSLAGDGDGDWVPIGFCPCNGQVIAFRSWKAASNMRSRGMHGCAERVVTKR